jgi:hypothetical protein
VNGRISDDVFEFSKENCAIRDYKTEFFSAAHFHGNVEYTTPLRAAGIEGRGQSSPYLL